MKKLIVCFLIMLLVFFMYFKLKDNKIYYLSIGDGIGKGTNTNYGYSNYINDYLDELGVLEKYINISNDNNRVIDLINDIKDNKVYDNKTTQNLLIKADLITISIGYNDLISKIDKYNNIDSYLNDLENLYKLIRTYSKETIIMIGYYNILDSKYDNNISNINNKVKELCDKYNIIFINNEDLKPYLNNNYPTIEGYHLIFNKIRDVIDNIIK